MFSRKKFEKYTADFMREDGEGSFLLLPGEGRIAISAPHSVSQTRGGVKKHSEPQTGALAMMLHESTGCPVIVKTANFGDDANYDTVSPYRDALSFYVRDNGIRYVLDLHQLSPVRKTGVNVGTGNMKNVPDKDFFFTAVASFVKLKIGPLVVDVPFSASKPETVSSHIARECGISGLQIEINSRLLMPVVRHVTDKETGAVLEKYDYSACSSVLKALERIVTEMNRR